jgi:hypothetical protein
LKNRGGSERERDRPGPSDLPIQQPTKFELATNFKDRPPTLRAHADEVIE